ncbi:hypothetical protein HK104_001332 [Borealophlyctis nickersoniae]|nr:hypothetical protein HK104_001332 [Borealophlyctis nickersoniae]
MKEPEPAPASVYLKIFAAAFICGALYEAVLLSTGYYKVMMNSEAREAAKQQMELEALEEWLARRKKEDSGSEAAAVPSA